MNMHIAIYIVTNVLSIVIMGWLAVYAWRHRNVQGAATFAFMNALGWWGALAEFLSLVSGSAETAALWFNARFITLAGIPAGWLIFSLQYSGRAAWIRPRLIVPLFIIPFITQFMVWTSGAHGIWLEKDVGFYRVGSFLVADTSQRVAGPWFNVHSIYGYALMGIGVVLVLDMAFRLARAYRGQAVALALGTAVLTAGAAIPTFNLLPHLRVNPVTQSLAVSALLFAWAVFRYRFLDIVPVARDILIDSMEDSMLVLDMSDRIVHVNRAMRALLESALAAAGHALPARIVGLPAMEVLHPWRDLAERYGSETEMTSEVEVKVAGAVHHYELRLAPVIDREGARRGRIMVLRDITARKHSEEIMRVRFRLIDFADSHTLGELLEKALDEVCAITESPIGFYHFVEPDQVTLSLQAWSTRTKKEYCTAAGEGMHYPVDQAGVWVDCIHQRRPVIHNDYASLPGKKGLPEGHAALVRELVVPIFREDRIVAILGVGNKARDYTDRDVEVVTYLADIAWEITHRKRAQDALRESEHALRERNIRMEKDLKIAQAAQKGIIVGTKPKCERIAVDFRYKPMEKVGGDYFSFSQAQDGSLGVFIGDVSGHGMAAALFISLLKSTSDRMFREFWDQPSKYLESLNREIFDYMASYFLTGIYGVFDSCDREGEVTFAHANGGHPLPVLVRAGGRAAFTGLCGNLMGISQEISLNVSRERLAPGDRIFMYTDGIPETINDRKEMIGFAEGLLDLFDRARRNSLEETLDAVMEALDRFRQSRPYQDDITLIGFEVI